MQNCSQGSCLQQSIATEEVRVFILEKKYLRNSLLMAQN